MTDERIIISDWFPLLELNSFMMPLPTTESTVRLNKFYENLLREARQNALPLVFTVMAKPGIDQFPERIYPIGIVASVVGVSDIEPEMLLIGSYRAMASKLQINKKGYQAVSIAKVIQDEKEEMFVEKAGRYIVNPNYERLLLGLLFDIKHKIKDLIKACLSFGHNLGEIAGLEHIYDNLDNLDWGNRDAIDKLIWNITQNLPFMTPPLKQRLIEHTFLTHRIASCIGLLAINLETISNAAEVEPSSRKQKITTPNDKSSGGGHDSVNPDDAFIKGVPAELAEKYNKFLEIKEFMNDDATKSIMDSFKRLKSLGSARNEASGAEWTVFMTHVDFMLEIPWHQETKEEADMNKVEKVLNDEHYGLDFAKVPILRYLAAKRLNPKGKGDNLLFLGPPGVGKTSLANSIAGALGRKLVRLSLGGVRDEAEIRGHRKTYVGALVGQIMQGMRRAGVRNPVFVFDELDKITTDFRGDPSAALLEVLDPEQNHSFRDHYLDAPYDLSQVLFIATANTTADIRPALLDRLEPVTLPGYTTYEKIQIAKRFLIPKAIINVGLTEHKIELCWPNGESDETLLSIIKGYTKESGVRNLERRIRTICRSLAQEYLKDKGNFKSPVITQDYLVKVFGQPRNTEERANKTKIGEAIGLAWTPFGGDILYVQSKIYNYQKFSVLQTGMQGKVMIEAGQVALSLLRDELEKIEKADIMNNKFIHIHVPEGAIEKDGPSAGITTFCSLYSTAHKKAARPYIAMTGEITLTGMVTRVGGIKEKVIAAESAGIKEVILPETNKGDLDEVPQSAKDKLKFHFVNNTDQVLDIVFEENQSAL